MRCPFFPFLLVKATLTKSPEAFDLVSDQYDRRTGSGVMSGTKILESKTIKNPSVWAESSISVSRNSSAGILTFLHFASAHRVVGSIQCCAIVIFVIK
jgi:hypothetical protein